MNLDSPWAASEADLNIVRENEWSRIATNFTNTGYREGITAGKESALQEGFDAGFAQVGAPLGRELGTFRGVASALVSFLASSRTPSLSPTSSSEARDILAQLANVRFSDIAPPDLEAEAHAREHLGGEEDDTEIDVPEELEEKRKMEKLEDMLSGMTANGDKSGTSRPTMGDMRRLKDRLYALCSAIGVNMADVTSA
ncbi:hypothetical protein AX15_005949 [Amanita polypyramis BW_CC]|nr:hypothetical protein AX15_005949 [Amanita polypyramis BW_CC]